MNYERILENIFHTLSDKDVRKIYFNKCSNLNITGNQINKYFIMDNFGITKEEKDSNIRIPFEKQIVEDKIKRAEKNVECFDRFILACNNENKMPIIRCYGLFSQLSSLRSRNDFSDYNQLIIGEKDSFDKMVRLNYKVKIIVSLDIPAAVCDWGYTLDETSLRITDLCNHVNYVCENNQVEIVVDRFNAMRSTYILDNSLLIEAVQMDPNNKYKITNYETQLYKIRNAIQLFDERFNYLRFTNDITSNTLSCRSKADLICKIVESHMEKYYQLLNEEDISSSCSSVE